MTGPYKENGKGSLWAPSEKDENPKVEPEQLIESLKESVKKENADDQWLGGYDNGDFQLEEMFVSDNSIEVSGSIGGIFLSLNVRSKTIKK